MDDQEIRDLLSAADRPRQLTEEERIRGLQRVIEHTSGDLPLLEDADVLDEGADALELDFRPSQAAQGSVRRVLWAVAAAVVLVIGVSVVALIGSDDETLDIADRGNTDIVPEGAFNAPCSGEVNAVIEGIEQWGSLENWAFAASAEPDVAALLRSAFDALGEIGVIAEETNAAAGWFDQQLAEVDDGELPLLFAEADGKRSAVEDSIRELVLIVSSRPDASSCDLARLEAAIAR